MKEPGLSFTRELLKRVPSRTLKSLSMILGLTAEMPAQTGWSAECLSFELFRREGVKQFDTF